QALNLFKAQARKYEKTTNNNPEISNSKGKQRNQSEIEADDILKYWHSRQKLYPSLAVMAKCFLVIPATSAPSKQVFSACKFIIGTQRYNLDESSIEQLLCLKEWSQMSHLFNEK
ncbi:uncharacterized protein VP01_3972g1, partial [Puccinia sorghi]